MPEADAIDNSMMRRCIELSRAAIAKGEYPFGAVISQKGNIVAEAINSAKRDRDVSRHAEVIALSQAQKLLTPDELSNATLYSTVEPCAMCSYCLREAWVGRVVYALSSPEMGGVSKWNILRDEQISKRVPIFGPVPEVVSGFLFREVQEVWSGWNPLAWEMIKLRGVLKADGCGEHAVQVSPSQPRSFWQRVLLSIRRLDKRQPVSAHNPPRIL